MKKANSFNTKSLKIRSDLKRSFFLLQLPMEYNNPQNYSYKFHQAIACELSVLKDGEVHAIL